MLGMAVLLLGKEYTVESNRKSGYGCFDLAIFPTDVLKTGILMDFKAAISESELEDEAEEALWQTKEPQYGTEFAKRGISKVWKYGIAFCGKQVYVRMKEK